MTKLIVQVVNVGLVGVRCYIESGSPVTACLAGVLDCNQTSFSGEPLFVGAGGLIVVVSV